MRLAANKKHMDKKQKHIVIHEDFSLTDSSISNDEPCFESNLKVSNPWIDEIDKE